MTQKKRVTAANPELRSTYPDNQTDDQDTSVILLEVITLHNNIPIVVISKVA